jgi:hypothetical protein
VATKKKAHPHQGQHAKDDLIAVALAGGETAAEAAAGAKVSMSTVRRRLKDAGFRDKVLKLRGDMVDRATGILSASSVRAGVALQKLLSDPDPRVRLSAARSILGAGMELRVVAELGRQLQEIKEALKARDQQQPPQPIATPFGG